MGVLGQVTEVIFKSFSTEELQEVEDFVLENKDQYSRPELKCIYDMLEVRNKILYDDNIVQKKVYKD